MLFSTQSRGWLPVVLASSALLYRLSWPIINSYSSCSSSSSPRYILFSLITKFIFVFTGLTCFISTFPAITTLPRHTSLDRRGYINQFLYYSAIFVCMVVNSINYVTAWRLALRWVNAYFTRDLGLKDPSRFNRTAVVLCEVGLSGVMLGGAVVQWLVVFMHCRLARRAWWIWEEEERRGGMVEKPGGKPVQEPVKSVMAEKLQEMNFGLRRWST
jgi:hypothetical protein